MVTVSGTIFFREALGIFADWLVTPSNYSGQTKVLKSGCSVYECIVSYLTECSRHYTKYNRWHLHLKQQEEEEEEWEVEIHNSDDETGLNSQAGPPDWCPQWWT